MVVRAATGPADKAKPATEADEAKKPRRLNLTSGSGLSILEVVKRLLVVEHANLQSEVGVGTENGKRCGGEAQ